MSVTEHPDSKHQAMLGRLAFLSMGDGQARVRFYASARGLVTDAAPAGPLVEIALPEPCGSVTAGVLTLSADVSALNTGSGEALWARVVNGAGDTAFDCSVSNVAGSGDIKLTTTTIFAGGETRLVSAVLR